MTILSEAGFLELLIQINFPYLGIGVLFEWNKLRFESELDSTLGYAYTGIGKNEDFYWREDSRRQVSGFDTSRWRFRDSGHSFEHADLFNIAKFRTSVLDHRWQNRMERDFFSNENIYLYWVLGLSFYENYFIAYDVHNFELKKKADGKCTLNIKSSKRLLQFRECSFCF